MIVCLSCSLVKRDLWVVYFHNHVQQSYFNLICECFVVPYMGVHVYFCKCVCACVWLPMLLSAASRYSLRLKWKVFLCHKAVSLFPWRYDSVKIPEKTEGGEKKSMSPITDSSLSLAGFRHASTHASTCTHRQWETHKQGRPSSPCGLNLFIWCSFSHWSNSTCWMFLIIAGECLKR